MTERAILVPAVDRCVLAQPCVGRERIAHERWAAGVEDEAGGGRVDHGAPPHQAVARRVYRERAGARCAECGRGRSHDTPGRLAATSGATRSFLMRDILLPAYTPAPGGSRAPRSGPATEGQACHRNAARPGRRDYDSAMSIEILVRVDGPPAPRVGG